MDAVEIKFSNFFCQKRPFHAKDVLIANPSKINVSGKAVTLYVDVYSNVMWKVANYKGWMNLTREDVDENLSKLTIHIDKYPSNSDEEKREGTITLESTDTSLKQDICIVQSKRV